jgi:hypothetical protein
MYEDIASHVLSVSVAVILGMVGLAVLVILTVTFQYSHWMGFDLTQSFTDIWLWILFTGSAICVTLINYGLYRRKPQKAEPSPLPQSSQTSDTVLDEQTTSVLVRLARSDYRHTLRDQLNYLWKDVDKESWTARFRIWENLSSVLKSLLVPGKPEYDALEAFADACRQFNENTNKADSEALKTLCKNRFEHLKELGLVY